MRSFGCFKSLEFTTSSGKHLCLSVAFTISFLFHTGKLLKTQHASRYLNSKLPRCENIEDAVHTLLLVITTSTLTIYMFTLADKKLHFFPAASVNQNFFMRLTILPIFRTIPSFLQFYLGASLF